MLCNATVAKWFILSALTPTNFVTFSKIFWQQFGVAQFGFSGNLMFTGQREILQACLSIRIKVDDLNRAQTVKIKEVRGSTFDRG